MKRTEILVIVAVVAAVTSVFAAPRHKSEHPESYGTVFRLGAGEEGADYDVRLIASSSPGNVFFAGEPVSFTFQIENRTDTAIHTKAVAELMTYESETDPLNFFKREHHALPDPAPATPLSLDIPAKGWKNIEVKLPVPDRCGPYAVVVDAGKLGRRFGTAFVRVPSPVAGKQQFPTFTHDLQTWDATESSLALFQRAGIKGVRIEWSYSPTTDKNHAANMEKLGSLLKAYGDHDITVLMTLDGGGPQPMGMVRPHLDANGVMLNGKADYAWLPQYDADYQKWVEEIASRFGWPKGPVNAIELWNEPWEGRSISGWQADMLRYREIFTRMAEGIEAARQKAGVKVLIGGACSTMNTDDKLFCDGTDTFLKWLDFSSIHYQPLSAWHVLVPKFRERKGPYGPVRIWDTESWFANTPDRIPGVLASSRAQGLQRTAGVLHPWTYTVQGNIVHPLDAKQKVRVTHAWANVAAIAAFQANVGARDFREILFKGGLPWVFVFDGLKNPDDGAVVVLGDLGALCERDRMLFRTVLPDGQRAAVETLRAKLDALSAAAPPAERKEFERDIARASTIRTGTMKLANPTDRFHLFDMYGNDVPPQNGVTTIPLNGVGWVLRTDGSAGSFDALLAALRAADIRGYEPVMIRLRDFTARIEQRPSLDITLHNLYNRPLTGRVTVAIPGLELESASRPLALAAYGETVERFAVRTGKPNAANAYPATVTVDAGTDGRLVWHETAHVNVIAHRTIKVDGDLKDWDGVPPQTARRGGESGGPSQSERAIRPFETFDEHTAPGVAHAYLAYDDKNFYYATTIADSTPFAGTIRFETRDEDACFYPDTAYKVTYDKDGKEIKRKTLTWPAGVRHYTYRRGPQLPSANGSDNVQIAFNVVPPDKKGVDLNPPGTMPRFMIYPSTDYEYVFNQVADKYGGGTEIFRLLAPGVPLKHFFPRQPKATVDGGPVKTGQLVMKRTGTTRLVEVAIPWTELPLVHARLDAGETIKFSYRVNDNGGPGYELAAGRSVSQVSTYAFHDLWSNHWTPELEFAFER